MRTGILFAAMLCALALTVGDLAGEEILKLPQPVVEVGQPLTVQLMTHPFAEQDCAVLLYDRSSHLAAVRSIAKPPEAPAPTPASAGTPATPAPATAPAPAAPPKAKNQPIAVITFPTEGLGAGKLTLKYGYFYTLHGQDNFVVIQSLTATLRAPAPAANTPPAGGVSGAGSTGTMAATLQPHELRFWRGVALPVDRKAAWEKLLADVELTGDQSPYDGPTLVIPRYARLSQEAIHTEIDPVLRNRGLVLCETWPAPQTRDDLSAVELFCGLEGPLVTSPLEPEDWTATDRQMHLLARRDPENHRLYGLIESSFGYLTNDLRPLPHTLVLRWSMDGTPAATLRLCPGGAAVVVLNAPVDGYVEASAARANAVGFLGVAPEKAAQILAGVRGGEALRQVLRELRAALLPPKADGSKDASAAPFWKLEMQVENRIDREYIVTGVLRRTARTLPDMKPPATVKLQLLSFGRVVEEWPVAVSASGAQAGHFQHALRIPLDDSGSDWSVAIAAPECGLHAAQALPVPLSIQPKLIDLPTPITMPIE